MCFFSSSSTPVLLISLIVANLISQQHLVLVCFSNGPLFKHLLASPSVDFPHVDSCQSMCVNTLVFTSNFLVGEARLFPLLWTVPSSEAGVPEYQGISVFSHITTAQRPQSMDFPAHQPWHCPHTEAGLGLQEAGRVLAKRLGFGVIHTWI